MRLTPYALCGILRFTAAGGVWRVAFAFDPERKAILLVAGDKSGIGERRFYRQLIKKADERFARALAVRSSHVNVACIRLHFAFWRSVYITPNGTLRAGRLRPDSVPTRVFSSLTTDKANCVVA